MKIRFLSPAAFGIAFLCLFLPFVKFSCGGQVFSYSAYQLMTTTEMDIDSVLMQLLVFFIIAGAVVSFFSARVCAVVASCLAGGGLIVLCMFSNGIGKQMDQYYGMVTYSLEAGFFLTFLCLLGAIVMNGYSLYSDKTASSFPTPPAFRIQGFTAPVAGSVLNPPPAHIAQPMIGEKTLSSIAYKPVLAGITGQYANMKINLKDTQMTIGRDPRYAQLVYSSRSEEISRRHCTLHFDEKNGKFVLEDYSSNGTFLYPNTRLAHGRPVYLNSGDRFYLADKRELFEVRLE